MKAKNKAISRRMKKYWAARRASKGSRFIQSSISLKDGDIVSFDEKLAKIQGAFVDEPDQVNHPAHYGGSENPYEVIKVFEAQHTHEEIIGGYKFMVMKYNARHRAKGGLEDLKKARFYQNRLVEYIESRDIAASVGP